MSITSPITANDLATALRAVVRGDVVDADDPSYPAACFGVRFGDDVAPELVVIAATAADLAAIVQVALGPDGGSSCRPPADRWPSRRTERFWW